MLRKNFGISLDDYEKYLANHARFTGYNSELLKGKSFAQERREIKRDIKKLLKSRKECNDLKLRQKMTVNFETLKAKYYENGSNIF